MHIRILAATGAAATAMIVATPALAAQEMSYEERVYEYAQPLPEGESQPVFVRQPVVQPVPAQAAYSDAYDAGYEVETEYAPVAPVATQTPMATHGPAGVMHPPMPHPVAAPHAGYPAQAGYPAPHGYPPMPPVADRDAWIADCRAYLDDRRRRGGRGGAIGSILGAATGGIIGNRVADSERLGGTLIGAGVGGLAGLAIGTAVGLAKGDPSKRECKRWLDRYEDGMAGGGRWQQGGYYPGGGWSGGQSWHQSWGYGGGYYMVAPTTVVIHHGPAYVPVVREIVTEEWVEEKIIHKEVIKHHPQPTKKVRYIKQKPVKRIKYSKGK